MYFISISNAYVDFQFSEFLLHGVPEFCLTSSGVPGIKV
jgi:hypothetical protein